MSNGYYTLGSLAPYTLAKAEDVDRELSAIQVAFDKLPAPEDIAQGRIGYVTDAGSANTIVASLPTAPTAYAGGLTVSLLAAADNTGATTINLNALGARALQRPDATPLLAGDITAGAMIVAKYDGSAFRLVGGGNIVENERLLAQAAAATAVNAPGTIAHSTTPMTIGTGSRTFNIEPGKAFGEGQTVSIAAAFDPTKQMIGVIIVNDTVSGGMQVIVSTTAGSGSFSAWTVAIASAAIASFGSVAGGGLATGSGSTGTSVTITVTAATKADMLAGTSVTTAATPKAIADMGAFTTLTDAASVTWNTNNGISSILTLTSAVGSTRALAAPTNLKDGWSYAQVLVQGTGGNMTATFDAVWDFDQTPVWATVTGKYNVASGKYCAALGKIIANFRTSA